MSITRYPVKSMGGEALDRVTVTHRGLDGDRVWAVYTADGGIGSGKTSRRFRRVDGLLNLRSRMERGVPAIEFPDGSTAVAGDAGTDQRLSELLGQPLAVRAETTVRHHDQSPVHLVTTAALRRLEQLLGEPVDPRRTRANLLLEVDGSHFAEDEWQGRRLRIGDGTVLALGAGMPRCVMVNAAQPGIAHDSRVLKTLAEVHDLELGLQATVVDAGEIATGDPIALI